MKRLSRRAHSNLQLIALEDRSVPATFTTTSFLDLDTTGFDPATGKLPTGEITLRSAILAANATGGADTVVAQAGTYNLTIVGSSEDGGATGDLDVTDSATLLLTGAVIDASAIVDRVLDVLGPNTSVTIIGGTFQGGKLAPATGIGFSGETDGGGIRNAGSLSLAGTTITKNQIIGPDGDSEFSGGDANGGGIASTGNLMFNGGEISFNTATGGAAGGSFTNAGFAFGGGLYSNRGTVQISNVRISGNGAFGGLGKGFTEGDSVGEAHGGGAFIEGFSSNTIASSRIDNNQAIGGTGTLGSGGGFASGGGLAANGTINVLNSTIDSNLTQGGLGIGDSVFGGNGGDAIGGGATINSNGSASIQNSTFSGNRAVGGDGSPGNAKAFGGNASGGGVYVDTFQSSGAFVGNVTITDNEAAPGNGDFPGTGDGGGLVGVTFPQGPTTSVQSSIVAGNRATINPDVSNNSSFSTPEPFSSLGNNLIGASTGTNGFTNGVNGDQVGTIATPLDPLLTTLGFFGGDGRALVHALNIGSPARDKGADGSLATDQRGTGFDRVVNGTADVGAFEVQIPATVTQNVAGTVVAGQPFTITGTVTDPRFPPTGTIEFFVNGNSVGSAMLDSSGNASVQATVANAGNFMVSIVYGGDAAYLSATSAASTFSAISGTTTAAAAMPDPSLVTQSVTLTAVVTPDATGTPTGAVQFFVDSSPFGSPVSLDMTGTATLVAPTGFAIGAHQLSASYLGDPTFAPSSSPAVPFTVVPSPTATSVFVFPNPVFATDPIFLSASVAGQLSAPPTGTVSFVIDQAIVGTAALDSGGNAFFTLSAGLEIGDGNYDVVAVYGGDANHSGSSSVVSVLNVIPVPTRTILSAEPNSTTQGVAVTLTANVDFDLPPETGAQRAGVNPAILAGSVNFLNGTTLLGTAPINVGIATLVVSNLPVGVNALTAVFVPATGNLAGSSGTASVTVAPRTNILEIFAASSGFGTVTTVKVYDADGNEIAQFQPYGPDYMCGAVVATGDVNGDRIEDVIVGTTITGGPHVKVYDGTTFNLIAEFFAYDPSFRGGVNVAAGDLDGDGIAEIVTGAGPGGGPQVNVFGFDPAAGLSLRNSFFAYDPGFRGGVTVAVAGGLLATGPGFTGGPHVKVFSGVDANLVASYFAFDPNSRSGVNVALSFDGNGLVLTAGTDAGRLPLVQTFDAVSGQPFDAQLIYEPGFLGGVTVTNVTTPNGETRQVFGTGLGGGPRVRVFGPDNVSLLDFFAFGEDFRGGVFVG